MSDKETYQRKLQARLDEINAEIDKFHVMADNQDCFALSRELLNYRCNNANSLIILPIGGLAVRRFRGAYLGANE